MERELDAENDRDSQPQQLPEESFSEPDSQVMPPKPPLLSNFWPAISPAGWITFFLLLALVAVSLAMSPYTYLLDELKIPVFLISGAILLVASAAAIWSGSVPAPPRWVGIGLVAFVTVNLLSMLTSQYHYAGWLPCLELWAGAGFFLAAYCAGRGTGVSPVMQNPKITGETPVPRFFIRGLTSIFLVVLLIGFILFDPTRNPEHHSIFGRIYHYNASQPLKGVWDEFFHTLAGADDILQSTILNADFYATFCLLPLPFAMLLALEPGRPRRALWRSIGILVTLMGVVTVILNVNHRHELGFVLPVFALFCVLTIAARLGGGGTSRRPAVIFTVILTLWISALLVCFGTFKPQAPWFESQFFASRKIIFGGALGIFKDHPVLGAGPGTFSIYFNHYRSPDYHEHGINNVTTSAHNYFLDILAQTGLFGLAAMLVLLVAVLWPVLRGIFRSSGPTRGLCLAAAVSVLGVLDYCMVSSFLNWVIGAAPFWTVLGFCAGVGGKLENEEPKRLETQGRSRAPWVAAFALGLLVLPASANYGVQYFRSQNAYAQALIQLESGTQRFPDHPDKIDLMNYFKNSIEWFKIALALDATNVSAYYKLGSAYSYLSQIEQSIAAEKTKSKDTQGADEHNGLSWQYLDDAVAAYEKLAQYSPDYAEIHYNLGLVYNLEADQLRLQAGLDSDAEKSADLKKAAEYERLSLEHYLIMARQSDKPEVALILGQRLEQMKQYPQALEILKAACERNPEEKSLAAEYLTVAEIAKDPKAIADAKARLEKLKGKK